MARLSEQDVIDLVRNHAAICGVKWGTANIRKQWTWYFRVRSYTLEVTCEDGVFRAYVPTRAPCVVWCDFTPASPDGFLIPPWLTCPPWVNQISIHWRMGAGEHYLHRWWTWFTALPRNRQDEYIARFPVTEREGWEYFWEMHGPSLLRPLETAES